MLLHARAKLRLASRLALVGAIEGGLSLEEAAAAIVAEPTCASSRPAASAPRQRDHAEILVSEEEPRPGVS